MTDFRCTVHGLIGGNFEWSNRICVSGATAESTLATDFATAVTALYTTATNGLENFMSSDVTVTGILVTTLNATMHQTTGTRAGLSIAGTDSNPSLPWDTAEVVTWRSAQLTHWGHGRWYLPPFAEDQIAAHVIKAATTAKMKLVLDPFFESFGSAGVVPFIYNQRPRKDGTAAFTKTNLINYDISDKPARQRRRVSKIIPTRVVGAP
jgi:hypothetical protein